MTPITPHHYVAQQEKQWQQWQHRTGAADTFVEEQLRVG
jgi:hypothetical protein